MAVKVILNQENLVKASQDVIFLDPHLDLQNYAVILTDD